MTKTIFNRDFYGCTLYGCSDAYCNRFDYIQAQVDEDLAEKLNKATWVAKEDFDEDLKRVWDIAIDNSGRDESEYKGIAYFDDEWGCNDYRFYYLVW